LGSGFLESIYAEAMAIALGDAGVPFVREAPIRVVFPGRELGRHRADMIVQSAVVLEFKAGALIDPGSERMVYSNERKLLP
jgi:GxxExxY protein